jgi:hypothetical protein
MTLRTVWRMPYAQRNTDLKSVVLNISCVDGIIVDGIFELKFIIIQF